MNYIEEYKKYLPDLKKVGKNYVARCPFHDDKHPSFFVNERGAFHCFGCGVHGNFTNFLSLINVEAQVGEFKNSEEAMKDYDNKIEYKYYDLDGNYLYSKIRFEKDGLKTFIKQPANKINVLYNLPDLLKRETGNNEIWLAEGEKCVESLKTLNNDAVVLGFVNFKSEYSEYYEDYFKNADVVIFEDNDIKGWINTKEIVKTLKDVVNSIKVFRFKGKGYPVGYDIADFLKENDEEDFWAFYEEMPYLYKNFDNDKVVITSNLLMSNIQQPEPILPELLDIPKGVVGVIGGRAGDGKSLYSLYCALYGWYNHKIKTTIISLEDPLFVIINRIKQLIRTKFDNRFDEYGDAITVVRLSNLNLVREGRFTQSGQAFLNLLENQAKTNELIFIDPAGMLLGDENSNQNVQLIVQHVQYIAEKNNVSIILIHHKRKFTDNSTEDMDILRGAGAITANARWVALLMKSANDIYLKIIKNNYLPLKRNAIILENIIDIGGSDV